MHSNRKRTLLLVLGIVFLILSACSNRDDGLVKTVVAMKSVANTKAGHPEAAAYDPSVDRIHRILVYTEDTPFGWETMKNRELLPPEWLPKAVGETELVVIITARRENYIGGRQTYSGGVSCGRLQYSRQVVLLEAQTGREVASTTLFGSDPPPFPEEVKIPVNAPKNSCAFAGSDPLDTKDQLVRWLCPYVAAGECDS